jgi:hypothetical protein
MLYPHYFSTLLYNMLEGAGKPGGIEINQMGHISCWAMMMTSICWVIIRGIYTTKKNTETVIDASKEVGLEVNTEKTKYRMSG